jgi:type II secretory pathway pseudopilin PulG
MKYPNCSMRSRSAGFSITEMVVSAAILVILGAGIAQSGGALRGAVTGGQTADVLMADAVEAMEAIRLDLKASGFVGAYPHTFLNGNAATAFDLHDHTPATKHAGDSELAAGPDREIIFLRPADADADGVPDVDGGGALVWDGQEFSYVRVDDATGTPVLERRIDGVTDRVLARNVERVTFETQADDGTVPAQAVRVTLHMRHQAPGGSVQRYFAQSMIKLRNE